MGLLLPSVGAIVPAPQRYFSCHREGQGRLTPSSRVILCFPFVRPSLAASVVYPGIDTRGRG